ncbi:MAG: hypothetical protein AAF580_13850 [Pseudomonadota bacterium]
MIECMFAHHPETTFALAAVQLSLVLVVWRRMRPSDEGIDSIDTSVSATPA